MIACLSVTGFPPDHTIRIGVFGGLQSIHGLGSEESAASGESDTMTYKYYRSSPIWRLHNSGYWLFIERHNLWLSVNRTGSGCDGLSGLVAIGQAVPVRSPVAPWADVKCSEVNRWRAERGEDRW